MDWLEALFAEGVAMGSSSSQTIEQAAARAEGRARRTLFELGLERPFHSDVEGRVHRNCVGVAGSRGPRSPSVWEEAF